MALFSKRLTCFYCGRRVAQPVNGPVRKFHCQHCDADNYLDQNGDITDPPTEDTNCFSTGTDTSNSGTGSAEFTGSNTFCSKCIRNQHLFRSSLAAYFPPSDDPADAEYERGYAQFKKDLEETYPQVCDVCGPRVLEEIRKKGYEAKSDHLRRMIDRSRASKNLRQARSRSWQSLLVYAGALGYWTSICGQVAWDVTNVLTTRVTTQGSSTDPEVPAPLVSGFKEMKQLGRFSKASSIDLASTAGFALLVGLVSIWWNPKLRMKVEGRTGRFSGFAEYYQLQLITLVTRCVFWEILKDPSASALGAQLPAALHSFMIIFTLLSVMVSRRVVKFNTRPLVDWSDNSWERPLQGGGAHSVMETSTSQSSATPRASSGSGSSRFPVEKLAPAHSPPREPAVFPTPPPEVDEMEWTPSAAKPVLQPSMNIRPQERVSAVDGPSPFTGSLPPAPRPPAWNLRAQPSRKHIDQVVQPNPFTRADPKSPRQWQSRSQDLEPVFRPPSFFPTSDLNTSTGLEYLFERAFNMDREAPEKAWEQQPTSGNPAPARTNACMFNYLRLGLILGSFVAWMFSQNNLLSITGNYIEACALGNASLIAGFALLESVKTPLAHWNGMEILVYITELAAAVHLGAHLPRASFEREYFDRYGKTLLMFMALQEAIGLLASYRRLLASQSQAVSQPQDPAAGNLHPAHSASPQPSSLPALNNAPWSPAGSSFEYSPVPPSVAETSEAPGLSFSSTTGNASFSSALSSALPPTQHYRIAPSQSYNKFSTPTPRQNPHSFTMSDLQGNDPASDYDRDSDTETVATTATTLTDATTRNIRYGRFSESDFGSAFSPRRTELGPGISGLSLEDRPASRRVTRSQTKQGLAGRRFLGRTIR
ncbi:hypothetical protein PDE_02573 [Penicillium oxalicum 114-2]|uniref:Ima1 N-terminal domain-containing protein n=1 Tax=Penicillium oxalicum (strain 114-2 / CGMCC 5302) TaxID=933388 RepID=S7ZBL5_PENO1|nr:hypothetical protein PDE_02573 [Penicillium oxalicum 114-2]